MRKLEKSEMVTTEGGFPLLMFFMGIAAGYMVARTFDWLFRGNRPSRR